MVTDRVLRSWARCGKPFLVGFDHALAEIAPGRGADEAADFFLGPLGGVAVILLQPGVVFEDAEGLIGAHQGVVENPMRAHRLAFRKYLLAPAMRITVCCSKKQLELVEHVVDAPAELAGWCPFVADIDDAR